MRSEVVVERQWSGPIAITSEEAVKLEGLGKQLGSTSTYWGSTGEEQAGSLIRCRRVDGRHWQVLVGDAVGVIRSHDLTITVMPKIPMHHLVGMLTETSVLPRVADEAIQVSPDESLWELIARWQIRAVSDVLRLGLLRDYQAAAGALTFLRGRLDLVSTTNRFYRGSTLLECSFEEFDFDHALNRILRAALVSIVGSSLLSADVRREARRALAHFAGVSEMDPTDMSAAADRRSAYYEPALSLAKLVIRHQGQGLTEGSQAAWSFLIPTPGMVEDAIRGIFAGALPSTISVKKSSKGLKPTGWSLNPDLVFGQSIAVGDVKYQLATHEWSRDHLYQATTFATGFRCQDACIVVFRNDDGSGPEEVHVGDVRLTRLAWDARAEGTYIDARALFVDRCRSWWESVKESTIMNQHA